MEDNIRISMCWRVIDMGWIVLGFVQLWKFSMRITTNNDATLCAYWNFYEISNCSSIINHWSKVICVNTTSQDWTSIDSTMKLHLLQKQGIERKW
jgi:hypothetical protein